MHQIAININLLLAVHRLSRHLVFQDKLLFSSRIVKINKIYLFADCHNLISYTAELLCFRQGGLNPLMHKQLRDHCPASKKKDAQSEDQLRGA